MSENLLKAMAMIRCIGQGYSGIFKSMIPGLTKWPATHSLLNPKPNLAKIIWMIGQGLGVDMCGLRPMLLSASEVKSMKLPSIILEAERSAIDPNDRETDASVYLSV
ncbi:unnamed protein product [Medioppia subpectinata]|uniref:Uncharacterized protein n=1 Tax=Medioppia subpectinata TaxID=1979941 RepID=A0A7R9KJM9_9ACAR|nr:unnamed protein product [Medioppia subpectinata]CAG2104758.1 unnamed protein product [Medioppia subpectinata]